MKATPEQTRKFIAFLREHMQLRAEVTALNGILEIAVQERQIPDGWQELLRRARQTPQYQNISEQYEPLFARFEQAADVIEVEQLLDTIP
jgi:hypothetical protein